MDLHRLSKPPHVMSRWPRPWPGACLCPQLPPRPGQLLTRRCLALTSAGAALVSKPSQTSTVRVSPALRSSCTASACVRPSRLCWFTSSSRSPTCRRPSRPAAPAGLTCQDTRPAPQDWPPRPLARPRARRAGPHLGDEDALVGGVAGVPGVALGAPTDADAQLLSWRLLDAELPQARGRRVPPHQQDQLQAGPQQGTDGLLVRGLPHVLPVHSEDAVPDPKATPCSQAPREHLREGGRGGSAHRPGAHPAGARGPPTLEMNTPGSWAPNGWLEWSEPPTTLSPSGPPALGRQISWGNQGREGWGQPVSS